MKAACAARLAAASTSSRSTKRWSGRRTGAGVSTGHRAKNNPCSTTRRYSARRSGIAAAGRATARATKHVKNRTARRGDASWRTRNPVGAEAASPPVVQPLVGILRRRGERGAGEEAGARGGVSPQLQIRKVQSVEVETRRVSAGSKHTHWTASSWPRPDQNCCVRSSVE